MALGARRRIAPVLSAFLVGLCQEIDMIMRKPIVAAAAFFALWASAARAEDNLKVGLIATLSGPPAVLGQPLSNGFTRAVKTLGGKLGGRPVDISFADDELKPDEAVTKVKEFIDRDKVD